MNRTEIEWVKNPDGTQGYTWNPITGCLNGCEYCYARKLADGRLFKRYTDNINHAPVYSDGEGISTDLPDTLDPFYPRFWPERLDDPVNHEKPSGIFVCDMGELFGDWLPRKWQELVFIHIRACPQHRFYLLTKQPQNLIKFSPFPDNCWVGVTITEAYPGNTPLAYLAQVEASVKYISFEPLLKWGTDLTSVLKLSFEKAGINWVIIGAQTKPTIYPENSWIQEIEQACDKAGIPVFEKNNLYPSGFRHLLRQEMLGKK